MRSLQEEQVTPFMRWRWVSFVMIAAATSAGIAQQPARSRTRAQQLVDETVARHTDLRNLELALVTKSGCATVASASPEDIGERCDADEEVPMRTGRPAIEAPTRDDPVYDITQALHDVAGKLIGAAGMDIAPQRGETPAAVLQRAHAILLEVEARIQSKEALLENVAPADSGNAHRH
jgi:hypothetical protein